MCHNLHDRTFNIQSLIPLLWSMATNSTTGVHCSLIVSWDQVKSDSTTSCVYSRQESVFPIPFNSQWIQITRAIEGNSVTNSTSVSIRNQYNSYGKQNKVDSLHYVSIEGAATSYRDVATSCLSKRISYYNCIVPDNIVWIIMDGYSTGKVWIMSISNWLWHLNWPSIDSEIDSIPLPGDFCGRNSSCVTGQTKIWTWTLDMSKLVNGGDTAS